MIFTASRIFQILDHIGIYMVIAGSYTPILLITLNQYNSAKVLCTAQWIAAILGSTFAGKLSPGPTNFNVSMTLILHFCFVNLLTACSDLNNPMTTVIELSFFLVMGFGAVLIWDLLLSSICFEALILLGGCATCYLTGIVFFILGEYKPIYHAIWHVFVVMAAALHWFCVYFYIVQVSFFSLRFFISG